ncbi:hypothetical protein BDN72DRAFT_394825 [Pluteus cervinus]|uniref:Uncharacterized protein n=1 Tax=Pluteus cervinus TaxID=181527 RepID=A0ACD3B2Z0_9AGAR|nr:hypothetical protein BDN72DRAFT_394825 [Pluteus cervinus]
MRTSGTYPPKKIRVGMENPFFDVTVALHDARMPMRKSGCHTNGISDGSTTFRSPRLDSRCSRFDCTTLCNMDQDFDGQALSGLGLPLEWFIAPVLVGALMSCFLFGALTVQVYDYFLRFHATDRLRLKCVV